MALVSTFQSHLEVRALAQFDSLVEKGEIIWEPTEEIKVEQQPFNVFFRISPITAVKPFNPNDKSRKPGFLDDDPEFTLSKVAPNHKLILNKYCWLRPQMILHTVDFQSQRDSLTADDIEASASVLHQLGERYMVIFNGGPDAGSSVAHKHLQVFPRPEWETVADKIAKDSSKSPLPFRYGLKMLATDTTAAGIYDHYVELCRELSISSGRAHSMLLVRDWLMVIPRACATIHGHIADAPMQGGANAMIGMLWLKSTEQFQNWQEYGPIRVLTEFGSPKQESA
ncbi:hypothetical protein BKA67DRAFT_697363 [Truncatella angustata]|uniref:Ap4A phosphorylase II n=1 Tax=Truncatella angustata TaxID=152316 RepID=A0A9P8UA34_9PEZI|nr:uncharacterized protein BKA67DRAFT_697363 [Truncatella angustata]KAH6638644.1 hypothetical protein BKA67DRAFT_697363 [Truncatella angustata]KAH8197009.1 hypothetical protein TruAng_008829 [Truncatella angustata]